MSKGYVYVLTNEFMPDLVKIGRTSGEPEARAAQLNTTGVPGRFKVEFFALCNDCVEVESLVHAFLRESRVDAGREFFRVGVGDAISVIEGTLYSILWEQVNASLPDHTVTLVSEQLCPEKLHSLAQERGIDGDRVASAINAATNEQIVAFVLEVENEGQVTLELVK